MLPASWSLTVALAAATLPIITAYSPEPKHWWHAKPTTSEESIDEQSVRSLPKCSIGMPEDAVRPMIKVIQHVISTTTLQVLTWITEVETFETKTEVSTSVVIMIEPSAKQGRCESTSTVIIPVTATTKVHLKRTTTLSYTPTTTETKYSTSWATQGFASGSDGAPIYGEMEPPPRESESSKQAHHSPQPRKQRSDPASVLPNAPNQNLQGEEKAEGSPAHRSPQPRAKATDSVFATPVARHSDSNHDAERGREKDHEEEPQVTSWIDFIFYVIELLFKEDRGAVENE
ncbi:hypothetical protein IQ07DRAFT_683692 [Pyrenochaeta sp. DS3sAY3a]|nr:hypothetical protein IQ07DRAFT_683692 [Pyrenochaeta sp. DS3sAY3a]